jgi:hypothetical protein
MRGNVTQWVTSSDGRRTGKGRAGSELFRAEHGDDEIDEQAEGDEADEDVFHGRAVAGWRGERAGSAHLPAEVGVGGAEDEKGDGEGDEDEIVVHDPASIAPPGPFA